MGRSRLLVVVFSLFVFQCIPSAFSQQASVSPSVLSFAPQVVNPLSPGSQPQTILPSPLSSSNLLTIFFQAVDNFLTIVSLRCCKLASPK